MRLLFALMLLVAACAGPVLRRRPGDDDRRPPGGQVGLRPPGLAGWQARRLRDVRAGPLDREVEQRPLPHPDRGGEPKRLTTSSGADNHPRWSPTASRSRSSRPGAARRRSGSCRWTAARPGRLTKLPVDVSGPIWSPVGEHVAFSSKVYPGKTPEETAEIDEKKGKEKSKVKIYDKLMIRHWDEWDDGKRSHLFVVDVATGKAKDLTPKLDVNTPPAPFGGSSDYAFSPNGKELAFTAEPLKDMAWSTNTDIWIVSVNGNEPQNLTEANPGADAQPSYSPDGDYLAFVSQARGRLRGRSSGPEGPRPERRRGRPT